MEPDPLIPLFSPPGAPFPRPERLLLKVLAGCANLGGAAEELLEVCVTEGKKGLREEMAAGGQVISVRLLHLADNAVGAKETELAADPGREAAPVKGIRLGGSRT